MDENEDLYSDGEQENTPTATEDQPGDKEETAESEQESIGERTALIPKSLCPDMKVGDEVVLKITGGHEKDWQVEYAPAKGKSSSSDSGDSDYD
jgi:hypothetical protein